ncbi:5'-nucleotidase SurE [Vitis vinifera]|uniref:5'-nucleotidase SurE n=1 Tax=Vitis vinifera TaxID=29760 RepID=A0A438KM69_VITVI|nr:5'-nucleotidase SurE [Vitis vinifera]
MDCPVSSGDRPKIMVTNDDGIDAPGLRALVQVLVSTNLYEVLVCAPDSYRFRVDIDLENLSFMDVELRLRELPYTNSPHAISCVLVASFFREKSAVSHSITWIHALAVKRVEIEGATAYAVSGLLNYSHFPLLSGTPADSASLGISTTLFPSIPDLVISGINMGSNCGYHIVYSGTVAGAREAFLNGIPSVSVSYNWVAGKSNVHDFKLAAEACLPIISAVLSEIKNQRYPERCFLNIDLPTDVVNHKVNFKLAYCSKLYPYGDMDNAIIIIKDRSISMRLKEKNLLHFGYKLTKQGKSRVKMGWRQVTSNTQGRRVLSTMTMDANPEVCTEMDASPRSGEHLLFKREVRGAPVLEDDTDYQCLLEGYITVTPLGALSPADIDCQAYFKTLVPGVLESSSSSAL